MESVNAVEVERDGAMTSAGSAPHRKLRWAVVGGVVIIVVGSLWYGFARGGGPTASSTIADCSRAFEDAVTPPPATSLLPGVVGLGSVASIATFDTPSGWRWCFDGMGLASGHITQDEMRSAVIAPVAVYDGSLTSSDVLMLVHHGPKTTSVIVDTASSRSAVVAQGAGFEVLRVSTDGWPKWHAPWPQTPVVLGSINGFDRSGRVTSSAAFTWCPGSINTFPGRGC
jgi:hypothetical protein